MAHQPVEAANLSARPPLLHHLVQHLLSPPNPHQLCTFFKKTNKPAFTFYGVHYATRGIEAAFMYYFESVVSCGENSPASPTLREILMK